MAVTKTASGLSLKSLQRAEVPRSNGSALARLSEARQALEQAKDLKDILAIRDMAVAYESFAKAARLGNEALRDATEVKLLAGRHAGLRLQQMAEKGERRTKATARTKSQGRDLVSLESLGVTKNESSRWQKYAKQSSEDFQQTIEAATDRVIRAAQTGSSVTYKNQPGIDATKGNVPLAGTAHLYTVSKLLWPGEVEAVLEGLFIGTTLHACCGVSKLGDVRLDQDEKHKPDIIADAADMPVEDGEYETVLCDPPYNGDHGWNHRLLAELARVASRRIIFQHWFIPAAPNGRYRKAQEKFALSEIYVWQPKTYFGRAQLVSVFDHL